MADGKSFSGYMHITELAAYQTVADVLEFAPGDLQRVYIEDFCKEKGIPLYTLKQVDEDMAGVGSEIRHSWTWVPLRKKDEAASSPYWEGFSTTKLSYSRLVPKEHLVAALALRDRFPELFFFVSERGVPSQDPYICALGATMREPVVFGRWEEPGL